MMLLTQWAGLRIGEVAVLRWSDVTTTDGEIKDEIRLLPDMTKRQQITLEIALKGQTGLDMNDAEPKYTLKSLPGQFSGMHLISIMYVGMKELDPDTDPGVDLSAEYDAAKLMQNKN